MAGVFLLVSPAVTVSYSAAKAKGGGSWGERILQRLGRTMWVFVVSL